MNRTVRERVGLVSVVSSLLFVGLEIRSNTAAVKGATLLGMSDQSLAVTLAGAQTPEIRDAITKVVIEDPISAPPATLIVHAVSCVA